MQNREIKKTDSRPQKKIIFYPRRVLCLCPLSADNVVNTKAVNHKCQDTENFFT